MTNLGKGNPPLLQIGIPRVLKRVSAGKNLLVDTMLALSLVAPSLGALNLTQATIYPQRVSANEETGGYPDIDAADCSAIFGIYSWCKGDPKKDISTRGYGYRNCTDWSAFRAAKLTGMGVPENLGHATTWDDNKPSHWISDSTPEPGDIAQKDGTAGEYGHVGVVEKVNKNEQGQITSIEVSEYNAAGTGKYSYAQYLPKDGSFSHKWHHFLDINGTGVGVNGEAIVGTEPNTKADLVAFETNDGSHVSRYMQGASQGNGQFNWGYSNLNDMQTPSHFALGDVNADKKTDIVAFEPNDGTHVSRYVTGSSNGDGTFNWGFTNLTDMQTPAMLDIGDIDGDGDADIVAFEMTGAGAGRYMTGVGQGNGQFTWNFTNLTNMGKPKHFALGDIDGDKKDDLVAFELTGEGVGRFMTGSSNGNSTFNWGFTNLNDLQEPTTFAVGDINGDKKADIVDFEPNNGSHVSRYMQGTSQGNGQFSWGFTNLNDVQTPSHFALGDINADGNADIVAFEPNDGSHVSRYMQGTSQANGQFNWGYSNLNDMQTPFHFDLGNFAE